MLPNWVKYVKSLRQKKWDKEKWGAFNQLSDKEKATIRGRNIHKRWVQLDIKDTKFRKAIKNKIDMLTAETARKVFIIISKKPSLKTKILKLRSSKNYEKFKPLKQHC